MQIKARERARKQKSTGIRLQENDPKYIKP
jgi:hypothetical protein